MSEQFVKLHRWMISDLKLTGNELLVFATIHHATVYQDGYDEGMEPLMELTGLVRSKVYKLLAGLKERGYIGLAKASKGRTHSTYISLVNRPPEGTVKKSRPSPQPSPIGDSTVPQGGHYIDNRYIDTPYSPPTRGTANADATLEHKPRTRKRKNRALVYEQGPKYTRDDLKALGISLGEEIYEGFEELRIE